MPATITIPPHYWAGLTEIEFLLTDSAGRMYPAELASGAAFLGGRHIIYVDENGASFTLPTNDEIPAAPGEGSTPSTWTIRVQQGRHQTYYRVSISSLSPPSTWNELIAAGTPVDPADIWSSRLWPPDGSSNIGYYGRVATDGSIEFVPPPAGTGDVSGPDSAIPGNLAVFEDFTGKNIVDGGPPGGGGGVTDLSNTPAATFVTIESSTGANTDVLAATQTLAGVLSATDKTRLDNTDAAGTARPPSAHAATHAAGQPDEMTPASIGADPAGSGAGAVTAHETTYQHARIPSAAQSDALNASPLLSGTNRVAGVNDIIADLGNTPAADSVEITSSAGSDTTIASANGTLAGVLAATDFVKIQNAAPQTGVDGIAYRQLDGAWVADPLQNDAPSDTQEYVRKDGAWVQSSVAADRLAGVTANDTTPGHLQEKLQSGDGSVVFSVVNPGGDERLDLQATGVGGGQANIGSNIGGATPIYAGMNGVALELRTLASTATVTAGLNGDVIELAVPADTFDVFGSAAIVSADLSTHKTSGDHDARYVQTAPADGNHYGQRDGNWEVTPVSPIGAVWTNYTWSADTNPTSPPVGVIKVNNADQTQATALYVNSTTGGGNNADHIWGSLQTADYLGIWETQSDREGIYYSVTGAPQDNIGWWTIPVAVVPGSTGGMDAGELVNAFTIVDPRNRNPIGGTTGQALVKTGPADHATGWQSITADLDNTPAPNDVTIESSRGTDTTIAAATASLAGVMVAADKSKLDGIAPGAEVNTVDSVTGSDSIQVSPTLGAVVVGLQGDAGSPGQDVFYGTNGAGVKGFHTPPVFSEDSPGYAPASGGSTDDYLRADGQWTSPPGGSSLHADLTDLASSGHPGSVITIPAGVQGNAVSIAANGTLQDAGLPPGVGSDIVLNGYLETGDSTTLPTSGTITVPMDGRIYEVTLTGAATLAFGTPPAPPVTASTIIMIKSAGNTLALPASTYWPNDTEVAVGAAGTITRYVMSLSPTGDQLMDGEVLGVP